MSTTPSLDFVKDQFDQWRATPGRAWRIPDYLWDQVIPLLEHYGISKILATLRINSKQLKMKRKSHQQKNHSATPVTKNEPPTKHSFVNISLPANLTEDAAQIELTRPDGLTLRFKKIDHSTLSELLKSFLGNSPCYN